MYLFMYIKDVMVFHKHIILSEIWCCADSTFYASVEASNRMERSTNRQPKTWKSKKSVIHVSFEWSLSFFLIIFIRACSWAWILCQQWGFNMKISHGDKQRLRRWIFTPSESMSKMSFFPPCLCNSQFLRVLVMVAYKCNRKILRFVMVINLFDMYSCCALLELRSLFLIFKNGNLESYAFTSHTHTIINFTRLRRL